MKINLNRFEVICYKLENDLSDEAFCKKCHISLRDLKSIYENKSTLPLKKYCNIANTLGMQLSRFVKVKQ